MGGSCSKGEKSEALRLCKEREIFIKKAIDSRYGLAAAHVSYLQSLRNIAIALRRFAEADEMLIDSPPSPSHIGRVPNSPALDESPVADVNACVREDGSSMPLPPEQRHSWNFFDPADNSEARDEFAAHKLEPRHNDEANDGNEEMARDFGKTLESKDGLQPSGSRVERSLAEKDVCDEGEDPSEFITHRAKDFLSSVKDIEHQFYTASESGKQVSQMLEASKIKVGYSMTKGYHSSASLYLASISKLCWRRGAAKNTDVYPWKRTSSSSSSSSSRNPLNAKDENDDSGSDIVDDFYMISGSHSSTLDRLYAWERKLYDEVKAAELIRREYDQKCNQLREQSAKDLSDQVTDKTRVVVKDLHSRIAVELSSVHTVSKQIEKMRDEELLPQLLELIQGLNRMWRAMLECHHTQYITISLAYHTKTLAQSSGGEKQKQIMDQLIDEVERFGLSFGDWTNNLTMYVEALNGWLQNCISQPQERVKKRGALSPRRGIAPPIFVLCQHWSAGIQSLPSRELNDAVRGFVYDIRRDTAGSNKDETRVDAASDGEEKGGETPPELNCVHTSLTRVLKRLTKFSEASLKMCEDVRGRCERARNAYVSYKPPRPFSI